MFQPLLKFCARFPALRNSGGADGAVSGEGGFRVTAVRTEGCTVIGQIPEKEELVLTPEENRTGEGLPAA